MTLHALHDAATVARLVGAVGLGRAKLGVHRDRSTQQLRESQDLGRGAPLTGLAQASAVARLVLASRRLDEQRHRQPAERELRVRRAGRTQEVHRVGA